jgi:hypothetical protein
MKRKIDSLIDLSIVDEEFVAISNAEALLSISLPTCGSDGFDNIDDLNSFLMDDIGSSSVFQDDDDSKDSDEKDLITTIGAKNTKSKKGVKDYLQRPDDSTITVNVHRLQLSSNSSLKSFNFSLHPEFSFVLQSSEPCIKDAITNKYTPNPTVIAQVILPIVVAKVGESASDMLELRDKNGEKYQEFYHGKKSHFVVSSLIYLKYFHAFDIVI